MITHKMLVTDLRCHGEFFDTNCDDFNNCTDCHEHAVAEYEEHIRADARAKTLKEVLEHSVVITSYEDYIRADQMRVFKEWFRRSKYFECFYDDMDEAIAEFEKERKMITHEDLIRYLTDDGYVFTYDESIEQEIVDYENAIRADALRSFSEVIGDAVAEALAQVVENIRKDERKKTLEFVANLGSLGNMFIVGGRNAASRKRYWVDTMLKEMQKKASDKGEE